MKLPPPDPTVIQPFGSTEEEAVISLALDHPEFFSSVVHIVKPQMFKKEVVQYIIAHILNIYQQHAIVPTRGYLKDILSKDLTVDDPHEAVLALLDRQSNPREVPLIKESLLKWLQNRAYGMLFTDEAQQAYQRQDYDYLGKVFDEARRLVDSKHKTFSFWDQYQELFFEDASEHVTTSFAALDREMNGGPSPGEVLCYMAATNVGKSIVLANGVAGAILPKSLDPNVRGLDTLLVSCEMSDRKISKREIGILTGIHLKDIISKRHDVERIIESHKRRAGRLEILEYPPEEHNVEHIISHVDQLRRQSGFNPKVIYLDYLDLMLSRNPAYNKNEYDRQKHVSTELRGLAKKLKVPVVTATQTNRSGVNAEENIGLNQTAESYGKTMSLDYIVSINQTEQERVGVGGIPRFRFYIIKNRDGRREVTIECSVNYNNMQVREVQ